MHQAGGKSTRKNKYTAEALETIKQDITRFQVQKDNGVQVNYLNFYIHKEWNLG